MARENEFYVIAGQRQLFLDDYGIERIEHLVRAMHQPDKKGAVIRPNFEKGETLQQTWCAPAWDPEEKLFKLWVITTFSDWNGTAYAVSEDGLHWTKPVLDQFEHNGSKENNIIALEQEHEWPGNALMNAIYDPDEQDPSRRYKGFGFGNGRGREPMVSADGVHWKRLDVPRIPSKDVSNMSYDSLTRTFIAALKTVGPRGRSVMLSTSKDFEHWTEPELIFHADDLDQELGREHIARRFADPTLQRPIYDIPETYNVDVYSMGIFRYEGLYVGLPSMYHQTGKVSGDWPGIADWDVTPRQLAMYREYGDWCGFHHVQLTCSRDLRHWERPGDRRPFIDSSPLGTGAYDLACIIGPSFPVVRGDELWLYYMGLKRYGGPFPASGVDRDQGAICLAVLRRDGFISLDADDTEGALLTKPFELTGGKLYANIDAHKGELRVEALDKDGKVLAVSSPLEGDMPRGEVQWRQGKLADLQGHQVSFRFTLRNAKLYSYWLEK